MLIEEAQNFCNEIIQADKPALLPSLLETFGQNFVKISKIPYTFVLQPLAMPQEEEEIDLSINSKNLQT